MVGWPPVLFSSASPTAFSGAFSTLTAPMTRMLRAHIDIAGPSMADKAKGTWPAGATGFGAATLLRFVESKYGFHALQVE